MSCYFDTSALVKVYHDEAGSAAVRAIYQRAEEIVLYLMCNSFESIYRAIKPSKSSGGRL